MKEKIKLSGVPETMLQTIYARAKESGGRGTIHDTKAEEIVGKLDYDFTLAEKDTAMHSGVIARTIVLDRLTGAWLQEHPGGTVVNVACGLDTRCIALSRSAREKSYCRLPMVSSALRSRIAPRPLLSLARA